MWFDRIFDLIGKLIFPRQQDWERRRNAKVMVVVVVFSLTLGYALWKLLKILNRISR